MALIAIKETTTARATDFQAGQPVVYLKGTPLEEDVEVVRVDKARDQVTVQFLGFNHPMIVRPKDLKGFPRNEP